MVYMKPTNAYIAKAKEAGTLKGAKVKSTSKKDLIAKVKADSAFRQEVCQNTANRLMAKYGVSNDVTYKGVHINKDTRKEGGAFDILKDGRPAGSPHVVVNTKEFGTCFISCRGISNN